jgi:callose synthase
MKWCKSMGISPNFSKANPMATFGPPAAMSRVFDLVLFFCIWGECANIRHMPEMLWWLYHKTMESLLLQDGLTQTRSLYDGHFLDHVVAPIYEVVKKVRQLFTEFQCHQTPISS